MIDETRRICFRIGVIVSIGAVVIACGRGRDARLQEVLERSRASPERIVELEAPFLEDADPDVRALAVWAIGESKSPGGAQAVASLVEDRAPSVRLAVARALCRLGEESLAPEDPAGSPVPGASQDADGSGAGGALDALIALAVDSDTRTRRAVIHCFAESGSSPKGVLPIALLDPDKDVRAMALHALTRHPEAGSLSQLQAAFASKDVEEQIAAVAAIRALHDPAALPGLETAASAHLASSVREAVEAAILDLRASVEPRPGEIEDQR